MEQWINHLPDLDPFASRAVLVKQRSPRGISIKEGQTSSDIAYNHHPVSEPQSAGDEPIVPVENQHPQEAEIPQDAAGQGLPADAPILPIPLRPADERAEDFLTDWVRRFSRA